MTRWEFWWEFARDPFLRLREAVYETRNEFDADFWLDPRRAAGRARAKPPAAADRALVAERLAGLLMQERCRDTASACLIALAKIGEDGKAWKLRDLAARFLACNDQELRETAALALGISRRLDDGTPEILLSLLTDDAAGRALGGGVAVNERTRAFAAYALGLLLDRVRDPALAHRITAPLAAVLEHPADHGRELVVAVIQALSQFPLTWKGAAAEMLRTSVVSSLAAFYDLPLGTGEQLVQAHVPTALGRLLSPGSNLATKWRDRFTVELRNSIKPFPKRANAKVNPHVGQSIALALGVLTGPWEEGAAAVDPTGEALLRAFREHKDHQTRWFAIQAVGRMGGARSRRELLTLLRNGGRHLQLPWIAMALGVHQAGARARFGGPRRDFEVDRELCAGLRAAFERAKAPSVRGAMALALGLAGDERSADLLRVTLPDVTHQEDLAGCICLGLGLMRDPFAAVEVNELMGNSLHRPRLVRYCAQALGLLGDHTAVTILGNELRADRPTLARLAAAANALGQIGDRTALPPLLELLDRPDTAPLSRAFAAIALGNVCDRAPLPWNSTYARDCNYRAATSTLTDGSSGILDLM